MTKALLALAAIFIATSALALEPIPGSITYGGGPRTKLQKSPIGTSVSHRFRSGSHEYEERYILQRDRSLKLVSRGRLSDR